MKSKDLLDSWINRLYQSAKDKEKAGKIVDSWSAFDLAQKMEI